jgi:uncharacterized tellurite resistance protein B-like protein
MQDILKESSVLKTIYGYETIPVESWLDYAYALLIVAGADGVVSESEMSWLERDFARIVEAPDGFRKRIKEFDWANADLDEILNRIKTNFPMNYIRALVYDSIKMAMADEDFDEDERSTARKIALTLNVPIYIARTIEGLVSTEKSVGDIRKSIFEIDEEDLERHPNRSFADILFNQTFALGMSTDLHLQYGYALMTIAGADGEVSAKEKTWYKSEFAPLARVPRDIVDKVINYNYKIGNLKHIFSKIQGELTVSFSKTLLYHAIRMARADTIFANEEKTMVQDAAKYLNVAPDIAQTIQYLVDTEERIDKMRKTLFGGKVE